MKKYPLILFVVLASLLCGNVASAQTLTLEGGGGFIPTTLTPVYGASLQIPIYAGLSVYGSYTRLTTNDPRRASSVAEVIQQYPVLRPDEPGFFFPQPADLGLFWGNQIWTIGATYTALKAEQYTIDVGAGWSAIQGITISPALMSDGYVHFPESLLALQYQGASIFALAQYKLSKEFSLQGKLSFYGLTRSATPVLSEKEQNVYPLTHGIFTIGVSFHPF